ncbi:MAG: twin-arginine translocase TatA/TatE family subunit [Actinomycetota bacterium]
MPNVGPMELLVVLIIALIVFGPKRLPELGRSLGKGIREFKGSVSGDNEDDADRELGELQQSKAKADAEAVESVEGEVVTEKRA